MNERECRDFLNKLRGKGGRSLDSESAVGQAWVPGGSQKLLPGCRELGLAQLAGLKQG